MPRFSRLTRGRPRGRRIQRSSPGLARVTSLLFAGFAVVLLSAVVSSRQSFAQPEDCGADSAEAAELVARFLDPGGMPDAASSYTGEMLEQYAGAPTLGQLLPVLYPNLDPASLTVTQRPVRATCEDAVYAGTVSLGSGGEDWYLYLNHEEDGWKLAAVRSFDLPSFYIDLYERLSSDPGFVAALDQAPSDDAPRITGTEQLAIMRLVLSPDSALRRYFGQHREWLDALVDEFGGEPGLVHVGGDGRIFPESAANTDVAQDIRGRLRSVGMTSISRDPDFPGCTFIVIGGVEKNEVGYLYAPSGCRPPAMTPDRFVLIDPITPGWFLYRTS